MSPKPEPAENKNYFVWENSKISCDGALDLSFGKEKENEDSEFRYNGRRLESGDVYEAGWKETDATLRFPKDSFRKCPLKIRNDVFNENLRTLETTDQFGRCRLTGRDVAPTESGRSSAMLKLSREWIKKEVFPSETPLLFSVIFSLYREFCRKRGEVPLEPKELVDILQSQFQCYYSDDSGNDESDEDEQGPRVEVGKERFRNYNEKNLDWGDFDEKLKMYKNLKFFCNLAVLEEKDSSDSGIDSISLEEDENSRDVFSGSENSDDDDFVSSKNGNFGGAVKDLRKNVEEKVRVEERSGNEKVCVKERSGTEKVRVEERSGSEKGRVEERGGIKRQLESDSDSQESVGTRKFERSEVNLEKKVKWSKFQEAVIENVRKQLSLEGLESSSCYIDAKNLSLLFMKMLETGHLEVLLSTFVHSFACREKHTRLCYMFKRIVSHVAKSTQHVCAVKDVYGHIFRLHLDLCKDDSCSLPKCKDLREMREEKKNKQPFPSDIKQEI